MTRFLGIISFELHFVQKVGTVLSAGLLLKQIMCCLSGHFVGNTILLNGSEITKIAVSFHSGICNTFST